MDNHAPLHGVRIQLSGSFPEGEDEAQKKGIHEFVREFARLVLRDGGTLVHGSHPDFIDPLREAATPFLSVGEDKRDRLELVRAEAYATDKYADEMSEFASIHVIPSVPESAANKAPRRDLMSMRDWMAERSDVIVAIGGKWAEVDWEHAGVRAELENALHRRRPTFVLGGFDGAAQRFLEAVPDAPHRMLNGLSPDDNRALAHRVDTAELARDIVHQIQRLPLVRGKARGGRMFRILSLNGGGLRGAFTAAVLARWADNLGPNGQADFVKHFDLIAGTSTGSILALGLGLGKTPEEILGFYKSRGTTIFPRGGSLRHWLGSKFDANVLEAELRAVFEGRKLGDSCCRLVIPTVRAEHGQAEVIVTPHAADRMNFQQFTAVDAALASASAPTYFDPAKVQGKIADQSYIDGGIWANNPSLPAIAEAVRFLGVPLEHIDVLSVGTLSSESDFTTAWGKGKLGFAGVMSDLFFAAQESAAEKLTDRLLGEARHLRVNQITPMTIPMDDTRALDEMVRRGDDVGKDTFAVVRGRFLVGVHATDWRA